MSTVSNEIVRALEALGVKLDLLSPVDAGKFWDSLQSKFGAQNVDVATNFGRL